MVDKLGKAVGIAKPLLRGAVRNGVCWLALWVERFSLTQSSSWSTVTSWQRLSMKETASLNPTRFLPQ